MPLVGRYAQRAFLSKMEDIAVMALAFCHAHEITLRDLEMYGVLQVGTPAQQRFACSQFLQRSLLSKAEDSDALFASCIAADSVHSLISLYAWQLKRLSSEPTQVQHSFPRSSWACFSC